MGPKVRQQWHGLFARLRTVSRHGAMRSDAAAPGADPLRRFLPEERTGAAAYGSLVPAIEALTNKLKVNECSAQDMGERAPRCSQATPW